MRKDEYVFWCFLPRGLLSVKKDVFEKMIEELNTTTTDETGATIDAPVFKTACGVVHEFLFEIWDSDWFNPHVDYFCGARNFIRQNLIYLDEFKGKALFETLNLVYSKFIKKEKIESDDVRYYNTTPRGFYRFVNACAGNIAARMSRKLDDRLKRTVYLDGEGRLIKGGQNEEKESNDRSFWGAPYAKDKYAFHENDGIINEAIGHIANSKLSLWIKLIWLLEVTSLGIGEYKGYIKLDRKKITRVIAIFTADQTLDRIFDDVFGNIMDLADLGVNINVSLLKPIVDGLSDLDEDGEVYGDTKLEKRFYVKKNRTYLESALASVADWITKANVKVHELFGTPSER